MSYQFQDHESVVSGIKRITREQLDQAIAQLKGKTDDDPAEAVHDARKCLKKVRAVLRLVRGEIGKDCYKRENVCIRDAGRQLSQVRDTQVVIETFDGLIKHFADSVSPDAFAEVRSALITNHQAVSERVLEKEEAMADVAAILKDARSRVDEWSIKHNNWSALGKGLKQVYKRGHQGLDNALAQPSVENFHEWRKRVKDLWYHLRILQPIWLNLMTELAAQTRELSQYLGDDHDLAVLQAHLSEHPEQFSNRANLEVLLGLINRRRPELQLAAKSLGERIYVEKPKKFVSRIEVYWQIWQSEINPPFREDNKV